MAGSKRMKILVAIGLWIMCAHAALAGDERPALWRVADGDTTVHVFGTIHVLKPGTAWLTPDLQAVVDGADTLYLELSPVEQSPQVMQPLVQKIGLLPDGQTMRDHLPADMYEQLKTELTALGLPEAGFLRYKPWLGGLTYAALRFLKLGYEPRAGVEAVLVDRAQTKGIPVEGLETAAFQLSLFDGMTDGEALALIGQLLEDAGQLGMQMDAMTAAWVRGDMEALDTLLNRQLGAYPSLAEKLLYSRNRNWMTELDGILDRPGTFVLAVGAGHLAGDRSLLHLAVQNGLNVTRIH